VFPSSTIRHCSSTNRILACSYSSNRKTAGSKDPAIQNSQTLTRLSQPAFFSGAAAAVFFSIARFNSSARGESTSALALIRNASRPPRWSTLLIALVETRNRTFRPNASEMKVTLHRFGRNRRLVLILEWLTLWPTCGPLAVSSQRRDISQNPLPAPGFSSLGGSKLRPSWERRTYRGSAPGRQGFELRAVSGKSRKMPSINSFARILIAKPVSTFAEYARQKPVLRAFCGPKPSYKRRIRRRHHGSSCVIPRFCGFASKGAQTQVTRILFAKPEPTPGSGPRACFCGIRVVCRIFWLR